MCYLTNFVETCYRHVLGYWWGDRDMQINVYLWGDINMLLPCFRIHGVVMFQGVETSTMAPTKNLTMEKNKRNLGRM